MSFSHFRLFLAAIWFGLAAYAYFGGPFGPYVPWFALIFGVYNLVRWYSTPNYGLPPPPPHRRRRPHDPPPQREYNPEFDFKLKQDHG